MLSIWQLELLWAPKPVRPLCQGILTHEYTYAFGAVDVCTGELDSLLLPHVNTGCMQLFLNEVSRRHPKKQIVMVIDGAGWHRSEELKAPANIYLLKLPPYAPELNPIEHVWDELREKFVSTQRTHLDHSAEAVAVAKNQTVWICGCQRCGNSSPIWLLR